MKTGYEVVVIGADHQNTLGIIRALGKENCIVHVVLLSEKRLGYCCTKSRFVTGNSYICESSEELLTILQDIYNNSKSKLFIIPTSDGAQYILDENYNQLKEKFYIPSIDNQQGKIALFMNKYKQIELAEKYGIPTARTVLVDLEKIEQFSVPDSFPSKCIIKPHISALGTKSDITVINSKTKMNDALYEFKKKGYPKVLLQEFLNKEYELVTFGCYTRNSKEAYYGTLKKLRVYPYEGGSSLTYAQFVDLPAEFESILWMMKDLNFNGLFDIETFMVNGKLYLNEINFRNSGNTWALVKNGMNTPYIWICDISGQKIETDKKVMRAGTFFMNETADLHYILDHRINLFSWLRDLYHVKAFNKFWIKDLPGSFVWYRRRS